MGEFNRLFAALAAAGCLCAATSVGAADRSQARSMIISQNGIVAAEHPLASQAGAAILAGGGNAIDAAIAANAMMGLVAPMMNGIGGDLFAIVYEAKTGKVYGLNASGWAPKGLTPEYLKAKGITAMPQTGIDSVTVPGAGAGWDALRTRFGTKPFAELLAPAISYARNGFPVTEIFGQNWVGSANKLRGNADSTKVYLPGGRAPQVGEVFRNSDLAWSYEQIAQDGIDSLYKGAIAERILKTSAALGGTMAAEDLAQFEPEWVEPISTTYRGWTVYEMPPNEQGIAALMMLNIMENFPIGQWGHDSARTLHTDIEAKKLAYADMLRYVADTRFAKVPVPGMLSKAYAGERAALIEAGKANCQVGPGKPPHEGADTTYLSTVDKDGNMVSLIQSNFAGFGSGVTVQDGGFVLHNRGGLFTLEEGHPNVLTGRKRPLHTIIPAFMTNGEKRIAFGIMGGWNQAQAHAQFVSNVADFGMNIQAALEAPRFTKATFAGCDLEMEARFPAETRQKLAERGHVITLHDDFSDAFGGGQAVLRDFSTGINYGASDPRKDGAATAEFQMASPKLKAAAQ